MLLQDDTLGNVVVPDDATPEELAVAMGPMKQQAAQQAALTQGMGVLSQMVNQYNQPAYAPKPPSVAAAMGMGPQYQNFAERQQRQAEMAQQADQHQQGSRLQQQKMLMDAHQAEKDSKARLDYEHLKADNEQRRWELQEKIAEQKMAQAEKLQASKEAMAERNWDRRSELADKNNAALTERLIAGITARAEHPSSGGHGSGASAELSRFTDPSGNVHILYRNGVAAVSDKDGGFIGYENPRIHPEAAKITDITNTDGTKQTVRIEPGQTEAKPITVPAPPEKPPTLAEIAKSARGAENGIGTGNVRKRFIEMGLASGYTPDDLRKHIAADPGIIDDNSKVPFYAGEQKDPNSYPGMTPAQPAPAPAAAAPAAAAAPTTLQPGMKANGYEVVVGADGKMYKRKIQ